MENLHLAIIEDEPVIRENLSNFWCLQIDLQLFRKGIVPGNKLWITHGLRVLLGVKRGRQFCVSVLEWDHLCLA